ncbi:MAG TPA: hypothetical protein VN711_01195 [Candidatus Saccharimonadales bacterium]|nr:hypothetical protein [Candidatus Saccharimonadales bacterium]
MNEPLGVPGGGSGESIRVEILAGVRSSKAEQLTPPSTRPSTPLAEAGLVAEKNVAAAAADIAENPPRGGDALQEIAELSAEPSASFPELPEELGEPQAGDTPLEALADAAPRTGSEATAAPDTSPDAATATGSADIDAGSDAAPAPAPATADTDAPTSADTAPASATPDAAPASTDAPTSADAAPAPATADTDAPTSADTAPASATPDASPAAGGAPLPPDVAAKPQSYDDETAVLENERIQQTVASDTDLQKFLKGKLEDFKEVREEGEKKINSIKDITMGDIQKVLERMDDDEAHGRKLSANEAHDRQRLRELLAQKADVALERQKGKTYEKDENGKLTPDGEKAQAQDFLQIAKDHAKKPTRIQKGYNQILRILADKFGTDARKEKAEQFINYAKLYHDTYAGKVLKHRLRWVGKLAGKNWKMEDGDLAQAKQLRHLRDKEFRGWVGRLLLRIVLIYLALNMALPIVAPFIVGKLIQQMGNK